MNANTQKYLHNLVKTNYDEIAADFDASRKKRIRPGLTRMADLVRDGDNVLDAGCGNGRLLEIFQGKKINYLGLDQSEKLVALAKKNYPGYNFITGDLLALDKFISEKFDFVFSIAVLHHFPGLKLQVSALEQLAGRLKPAGRIIITVWNLWRAPKFQKLILKFALLKIIGKNKMGWGDILFDWKNSRGEKISRRYYHAFTKWQLRKAADKAGLKIERLYKDQYNYYLILSREETY